MHHRIRLASAALALCAVAGAAHAELVWDGAAEVAAKVDSPGRFLVCPAGTRLLSRPGTDKIACYKGTFIFPTSVGAPEYRSLQEALDLHFKPPVGMRAIALGPLPVYDQYGPVSHKLLVAYKLIKQ